MENQIDDNIKNQLLFLVINKIDIDETGMKNLIINITSQYKKNHNAEILRLFIILLNEYYINHKNDEISKLCVKYSIKYINIHSYDTNICAIGAQHAELIAKYDITIGLYSMALLNCKEEIRHIYLNNLAGIYFSITQPKQGIITFEEALMTIKQNMTNVNFKDYLCIFSNMFLHILYQEPNKINLYETFMNSEKTFFIPYIKKMYEKIDVRIENYHKNQIKKIGIISNDFHAHPVGYMITTLIKYYNSIYEKHNIELYMLNNSDKIDKVYDYIYSFKSDHVIWKNVDKMEDEQLIKYIYDEHIDVIIDMMGYTNRNRMSILAFFTTLDKSKRPYIYSYFAFPAKSGISDKQIIDKNIYDIILQQNPTKKENDNYIILKHCLQCYHYPIIDIVSEKTTSDLFRMACFNNPNKITSKMIEIWSSILIKIPNSILVLQYKAYQSKMVMQNILDKFITYGIRPDRIRFNYLMLIQLLESYNNIDIALDITPYNGGCITSEALYMNTPVICFHPINDVYNCSVNIDISYQSAVSYTLNKTLGLDELICSKSLEYINKVIELSKNREKLNWYHTNIRRLMKENNILDSEEFMMDLIEKIKN